MPKVDYFNSMLFHKAAIKADLIKQKWKAVERQNADKWFDQECRTVRKALRKIANEKYANQTIRPCAVGALNF